MTTYEKIISRHGTDVDYLIKVLQENIDTAKSSLESWRDLDKHNDSDHDGHYNRKHYIDHFYGMVMGYENSMSQLIFLKDAKQCYCFDCKHYCTTTIESIGQQKRFCKLFEMIVTEKTDCEYKDLNV